jgi:tRNA threonylcarbamoyladenosine modification (KEOPS) complex  Pcc1 subunit
MSEGDPLWTATLTVRAGGERLAEMLERSLRPEAEREVPRARAVLRRSTADTVELAISARDSGAMRAGLNTYLGWVALSLATARSANALRPAVPTHPD